MMNFNFKYELEDCRKIWFKEGVLLKSSGAKCFWPFPSLNTTEKFKLELLCLTYVAFKDSCYDKNLFRLWPLAEWRIDKACSFIYFSDHGIGVVFFKIDMREASLGLIYGEVEGLVDEIYAQSLGEFFWKLNNNSLI
jgi:hypothetical protein